MVAAKTGWGKNFGEVASQALKDALENVQEKLKESVDKASKFRQEMEPRKKEWQVKEGGFKVDDLEALVNDVIEKVKPFEGEKGQKMTELEAEAPLAAFMEAN